MLNASPESQYLNEYLQSLAKIANFVKVKYGFSEIIQKLVSFVKRKLHYYANFTLNLNVVNKKKIHADSNQA